MSGRTARKVVWALAALLVVLLAVAVRLTIGDPTSEGDGNLAFVAIVAVGLTSFSTIGLLIAAKAPHNPIGWLYAVGGLALVLSISLNQYAIRALTDMDLPGAGYAQVAATMIAPAASLALVMALLLFPTGALASRRWKAVAWSIVASAVLSVVSVFTTEIFEVATDLYVVNPLAISTIGSWDWLGGLAGVIGAIGGLGAFASIIVRYVRARDVERQQIRWLAVAVGFVVVSWIALTVAGDSPIGNALWFLFSSSILVGLPAATAVAVLRYRLYDLQLVIRKTMIFAITVGSIMAAGVFLVLAASGPLTDIAPDETLAVGLAGLVGGALIWPLWKLSTQIADRLVFGGRTSPYEALTVFSDRLSETYATDDVLTRMAALVGEVTRATQARVWVEVADELQAAACWPAGGPDPATLPLTDGALPAIPDAHHAAEIRDRGELLGALTASFPANDPLDAQRRATIDDLAAQAGPVLRNVRLIEELRASRRRIVGMQDARAKKLERDIHDGAQQQLVALAVKLRLAAQMVDRDPPNAREMLGSLQEEANDALETLRSLARGIYPPLLADGGLAAALEAQARRSTVPVTLRADGVGRLGQETEASVYFCVLEALANASKYADASSIELDLSREDGRLRFEVRDDGRGFDVAARASGTGLQGMADRIEAIGGHLEIRSEVGRGTTVSGAVPVTTPGPA